ncbi:MAG TPA: hypothetical protein VMD30_10190, partial [Tepidisphaeraceae bacterium]|nr:hypothetical protein [Tepidisphaeraceae bacterium]
MAIVAVAPMARNQHKSWAFAAINLCFLDIVSGNFRTAIWVLAGCVIAWLVAVALRHSGHRKLPFVAALCVLIAVFIFHKRPGWFSAWEGPLLQDHIAP